MAVIAEKIQFQEKCIEIHLLECFGSKFQQDKKCSEKGKKHKTQEKYDVVNFFVVCTIVRSSLLCQSPSITNSQVYVSEQNQTTHKRPNIHLIEQVLWATDIPHEVISMILCASFCRFCRFLYIKCFLPFERFIFLSHHFNYFLEFTFQFSSEQFSLEWLILKNFREHQLH